MKSNEICSELRKGANFAAANLPLRPRKTTMTVLLLLVLLLLNFSIDFLSIQMILIQIPDFLFCAHFCSAAMMLQGPFTREVS